MGYAQLPFRKNSVNGFSVTGNVTWVDQADATSDMLAYVNSVGNAILKVDNTTDVVSGQLRNSVSCIAHVYDTIMLPNRVGPDHQSEFL